VEGFAFLPTPGPGLIIVIGIWMLAGEFLRLARFFERLKVRLRNLGRWIKECWKTSSALVRVMLVLMCAAALGTEYTVWSQAASWQTRFSLPDVARELREATSTLAAG
jgi:hypothetical protein